MRILMLTGGGISNRSGGVGTMMAALRNEWPDDVHVEVIDTRGPGGIAAGAFTFARAALQFAAARRIDVVHLHMTTRGSMVRKCLLLLACAAMRRPAIVHMHGADFAAVHAKLRPAWRWCLRQSLRMAHRTVVLGEAWKTFLVEAVGLPAQSIAIIRNGTSAPPTSTHKPAAEPHILFLGRLGDRKGVPDLLAALASPAMQTRPWRATLAGDGEIARFTAMAVNTGLASRIAFPGWLTQPQAAALLASADILVLPSFHEALPMAVVEALAHAVAVIATPVGTLAELLHHEHNALLIPPGDAPALALALGRLLDDPTLRARIASAGHALFRAELDVAVTARQMFLLYAGAATAGAAKPGDTRWAR